ncbi:MAG: M23 family metallopeptidase, partial [Bacteroidota bacterium]
MNSIFNLIISFFFAVGLTISAQDKIPNTFRYPLDVEMKVGGNYGELRPNHFHAGLDLSTDPVKNLPIHSIEKGYVSRIKISSYGYGKVLYVTHPGGYVSVYAHQHHFAKKIADYIYAEQKKLESFDIEVFPKPEELPVEKSEVIGFTGNTGRSSGPHLHFEIRDEKTETPLNPLLFYEHQDNDAPVVKNVTFYSVFDQGKPKINKSIAVNPKTFTGGIWTGDTIFLSDKAGLGFSCFDRGIKNGDLHQVYSVQIKVDGEIFYQHKMNNINFEVTRCIGWFQENDPKYKSEKIQKCFRTGNNELPIFDKLKNNGILTKAALGADKVHSVEALFYDINGNKTALKFNFLFSNETLPEDNLGFKLFYSKNNKVELKNAVFEFPEKSLFHDTKSYVSFFKQNPGNLHSDIYSVLENNTLLMKKYSMKIKIEKDVSPNKQKKLCAIGLNSNLKYSGYI